MKIVVMSREVSDALDRLLLTHDVISVVIAVENGNREDGKLVQQWVNEVADGNYDFLIDAIATKLRSTHVAIKTIVEGDND